jgi:hypothetical protein
MKDKKGGIALAIIEKMKPGMDDEDESMETPQLDEAVQSAGREAFDALKNDDVQGFTNALQSLIDIMLSTPPE